MRDLMNKAVVVAPDTSVRDLIRLLSQHRINGCPVLDAAGRVLGTVSTTDLLWLSDQLIPLDPDSPEWEGRARELLDERSVREIMTPDAFGLGPDEGLDALSRFFARTGLHRALVLEEGRMVGVVSISDLLALIARERPERA